ncbi:unnamed protein product [Penicillium nalgiovense]|nr:unnamed protein product [Penicillium nalgiovense]
MKLIGPSSPTGVPLSVFDDIIATILRFLLRFGWLPYRTPRSQLGNYLRVSNINKLIPQAPFLILYFIFQVMHTQSNIYPKRSISQTSATSTSSQTSQLSQEKKHSKFSNPLSKIFRSKTPAPIDILKSRQVTMSQPRDIPRSNPRTSYFPDQGYISNSPTEMPPSMGSPHSFKADVPKRASTPTHKNSGDYKRYSGTVNHYGRHSNDWLFGGFSVRETVRDGLDKLRSHDKES